MIEGNCIDAMSRYAYNNFNVTDNDEILRIGQEDTNAFLMNVSASGLFLLVPKTQGSWIWKS